METRRREKKTHNDHAIWTMRMENTKWWNLCVTEWYQGISLSFSSCHFFKPKWSFFFENVERTMCAQQCCRICRCDFLFSSFFALKMNNFERRMLMIHWYYYFYYLLGWHAFDGVVAFFVHRSCVLFLLRNRILEIVSLFKCGTFFSVRWLFPLNCFVFAV